MLESYVAIPSFIQGISTKNLKPHKHQIYSRNPFLYSGHFNYKRSKFAKNLIKEVSQSLPLFRAFQLWFTQNTPPLVIGVAIPSFIQGISTCFSTERFSPEKVTVAIPSFIQGISTIHVWTPSTPEEEVAIPSFIQGISTRSKEP